MTKGYALSVEHVVALLGPEAVIAACGVDARQRGRAYRLRTCPACGDKPSRQGAAIYRKKDAWRWTHHGHPCGGSLLDLVAAAEGLDFKRDFKRLLERGAQIAGITPSDPDLERRIREQIAADRARQEVEDRARATALAAMPALWESLHQRSVVGENYLLGRSLDPAALRAQGDIVRYSASGEVALAERDLVGGAIVGIQYRASNGKGFRSADWSAPDESALVGRLVELDRDGVDVAVVVEGLADTLAARLAFPSCAVFGAAGAAHLEHVTAVVAARVKEIGGWLLLLIDDDETGIENGADAIVAAQAAGLELDRSLLLVDLGEHHDLADAYATGWRWTWPS